MIGKSAFRDSLKNIFRRFQIKTLKNRFLATMLILTIVPFTVQAVWAMRTSRSIIEQNYIDSSSSDLVVSSRNIDLLLNPIIQSSRIILGNQDLQRELIEMSGKTPDPAAFHNASLNAQIIKLFTQISMQNAWVDSIYLIAPDQQIYFFSKSSNISGLVEMLKVSDLQQQSWYIRTREAKGLEVFTGYDTMLSGSSGSQSRSNYFTCSKLLKNLDDQSQEIGILVISVSKKMLNSAFSNNQRSLPSDNLIIDSRSDWLPVYQSADIDPDVFPRLRDAVDNDKLDDSQLVIINSLNRTTGWQLFNVLDRSLLGEGSRVIAVNAIWIAAISIIILAFLMTVISGSINRPLKKLEDVLSEVAAGNRNIQTEFDDSEIGQIGNQFKSVVNNNLELNDRLMQARIREQQAELIALQEQINPHFLYNTLDSLYWMATIRNEKDIADLVVSVSKIFKLTLNKGGPLISVRDELDHIRHYLNIQKLRYKDKLDVVISVEPSILDYKIIKLTLQPFIENAIYHGIEPKLGSGHVWLDGRLRDGQLIFTIRDDGVGMENTEKWRSGYGVRNVQERLLLYYGDTAELRFMSDPDTGTVVTICMPAEFPDERRLGNVQGHRD